MGYYGIAAICKNGHVYTDDISNKPLEKFCKKCGQDIICKCPNCQAEIQGYYYVPGVISLRSYGSPSYCHSCGKPYPWMEMKILAAKMLVEDMDELNDNEKKKISESIDNIIIDSPLTEVSANRIKKGLMKVGVETAKAFRDVIVNVASEAAKKALGL